MSATCSKRSVYSVAMLECGPADVDNDGIVGVNDLLIMLGLFGDPCQ